MGPVRRPGRADFPGNSPHRDPLLRGGGWFAVWSFVRRPFPALETVPLLDLLEYHNPNFYSAVVVWYYLSPLVTVMLAGSIILSIWKVWVEARKRDLIPFGALPAWPLSPDQPGPEIVIGEVHHPVEPREIFNPEWLTIPERGLYTGIAIFGAVGSGKTSACMHPFAKQILGWQADDPERRAAALMLEVKGDFCHDVRSILDDAGRGDDYLEIGMGGLWKWNPLSAWWLDSYSLAYTVASLLSIPIVATQSISSLRAVLGSSEAWRALLQTLRTRIFLSLSDDASAKIASELCGQVAKIKGSYTISETSKRAGVSPLSGRAGGGGGSIGATKSFQERREAVFHPRDFTLLGNCQAICLPYDGAQSLEPRRVYLKPHYLPLDHSYWRAKEAGEI